MQEAGISKITTVLFHLLGPSQHLVIGAAVGIGKVQQLMKVRRAPAVQSRGVSALQTGWAC